MSLYFYTRGLSHFSNRLQTEKKSTNVSRPRSRQTDNIYWTDQPLVTHTQFYETEFSEKHKH